MRWDDDDNNVLVRPGRYPVFVASAEHGETAKGDKCLRLVVTISEGEYSGADCKKTCVDWIICKLAKALGFPRQQDPDGKAWYDVDPPDLIGQQFTVDIGNREYKGHLYSDVGNNFEHLAVRAAVPAGVAPSEALKGNDIPF